MATMRDVANAAGVSTATVSRVLSNHPAISPGTRDRVLASVEALSYRPNGVARSLRSETTATIGLVVSNVANPFFAEVARAVEDAAAESGLSVVLGNADESSEREARYLDVMMEKRVDGLVLSPTSGDTRAVREVLSRRVPLVFLDRTLPMFDVPSVSTDPYTGIQELVQHLFDAGHQSAAVISGSKNTVPGRQRLDAFLHAARDKGIRVKREHVVAGGFQQEDGARAMRALLRRPRPLPSVVFVSNNLMTLGALLTLKDAGLTIPGDVAIASYDDSPWFEVLDPPVTAVAQPVRDLGRIAVDLITAVIRGEHPKSVSLPAHLIVRASSGGAR